MSALDRTPFGDCSGTQVTPSPLPMPPENLASAKNTPCNGVVEAWPALTEYTSPGPVNHLLPRNYAICNARPNSMTIHAKTVRRCNGGGPPHGRFIHPSQVPTPPSFPAYQLPVMNNNWNSRPFGEHMPRPHSVYDHHGMSRRVNYSPLMRGNGVHQNNGSYGNGRNIHMHQPVPYPRSFWGPSSSSSYMPPTPFYPPQPMRAYGNSMSYQIFQPLPVEALPLEHYRGPQFVSHYPVIQPIPESHISTLLVHQINYYFCDANLVGDWFLKSHMDDQGWVSIELVAGFPRVKKLTNDIQLVLDSLKTSTVVEVQGDKIRRRNEWINWIPNKNRRLNHSVLPSELSQNLETNFQNLKIEEGVNNQSSTNGLEDSMFSDDTGKVIEAPNGEVTNNAYSRK